MKKTKPSFAAIEDSEIVDSEDHGLEPDAKIADFEGVKTGEQLESYIEDIADTVRVVDLTKVFPF